MNETVNAATAAEPSDLLKNIVREAMRDAWNEICADTEHHPVDIEHRGRRLFFEPRHWADQTASLIAARLVDDERYRRCTITGFVVEVFDAGTPDA